MTATKIQPCDDTHLTLLMAPHSLNFVTGADRAALLAYGRDVFAAARDSKCLAQIEEPAQPVAEICSASHDDAQFGERAIKPLRDISGFEYGTPLHAGAAPAAAAPQGDLDADLGRTVDQRDTAEGWADGLAGLIGKYFGRDIGEHSSAHCPWQEAKDIIEEAEPYQPAAVTGPAWGEQQVHALAIHMAASAPPSHKPRDYDADMAWARSALGFIAGHAQAAPALEAPAAPSRFDVNELAQLLFDAWAKAEPEHSVTRHPMSYWASFCDMARAALAAAPQTPAQEAPAAPAVPAGFALVPIEPTQQMLDAGRWSGAGSVSIQEEWARKEVWNRMLATITPPPAAYTDDLVALVTELVQALRQAAPDNDLAGHALDYLRRNGLQGSPLRAAEAAPQAPAAPWKDHQTARLVNDLRDCAIKYHGAGQLRERIAHIVVPLCDQLKGALAAPAAPAEGEVLVEVIGLTGSGKSAICGEIEILCRALGLDVSWPDGDPEKNMTHAEWTAAIEAYKPRVRIVERNVPRQSNGGPAK